MSYKNISPLNRRLQKSIELLKPPPKQTVSEWAVANRILSSESSSEPGKYILARAPFQKGWQGIFLYLLIIFENPGKISRFSNILLRLQMIFNDFLVNFQ